MTQTTGHRLLRASAGTGKTYQLVEAYVRLIEVDKLRPAQIVAITFTRKAAAELRLRIRAKLMALGAPAPVLAELARAPLGNFHGLSLQLMGSFGLDAGLTGPLRVLAEAQEDRALFVEACRDVWFSGEAQAAEAVSLVAPYLKVGDALPEALWEAIALGREDDVQISAALVHAGPGAKGLADMHAQMLAMRAALLTAGEALTAKAVDYFNKFKAAEVPACPDARALLPTDAAGLEALADALEAWRAGWLAMFGCLNRSTGIKKIYSAEAQSFVQTQVPQVEADVMCACLTPAVGILLEHAWRGYTRLKQERGVVDFVDIITRLNHLLETREDLRRNVRQRFSAILVDEAQDTNRLQRRMVNLLCGFTNQDAVSDAPTHSGVDAPSSARVFVVGDWKQSIYTFRGADPQSFDDFASAVKARGGEETTLSISRRSAPAVVRGINSLGVSLFAQRYEALDILDADGHEAQATGAAPLPGTYWVTLPAGDKAGTKKPVKLDPAQEAQSCALWIQKRIAQGAQPGDFVILLSAMTAAPAFLGALQRLGVQALLGGGGGLYAQAEVLDHLGLLAWLADEDAVLQAAICLRSPLFGLTDSALWALLGPQGRADGRLLALRCGTWHKTTVPLAAATQDALLTPDDDAALAAAARVLPALVAASANLGTGALLEVIDDALDARAIYLGLDSGPQRVANIQRLWRFAHAHDKAYGPSLSRFVAQQAQRVDDAFKEPLASVPTAGRVAVTISTVHQSKGLQYPIVVLPRLGAGGRPSGAAVAYDRQQGIVFRPNRRNSAMKSSAWERAQAARKAAEDDERKRLLYVAMTRAERELVFVGPPPENLGKPNFGSLLKAWAETAPDVLTVLQAPDAPEVTPQREAGVMVLDVPRVAPPTRRTAPPGTAFRVTVTALAQADMPAEQQVHMAEQGVDKGMDAAVALGRPAAPGALPDALAAPDAPLPAAVQGEVAHGILACIGELTDFASEAAFVADGLGRFGYAADDSRLDDVRRNVTAFLRSALGRRIACLPAEARRQEMPFQLVLPCGAYKAVLHGQLDLAFWDSAGLTIVDYKHARPGPHDDGYLRQLDAYAYAMAELCGVEGDVTCYLVYLKGNAPPYAHTVSQARQRALRVRLETLVDGWAKGRAAAPACVAAMA